MPRAEGAALSQERLGNEAERLSTIELAGILVGNHAAARRWMINVIAAKALELFRERQWRKEGQAPDPGGSDDGHDGGTTKRESEKHRQ